MLGCTSGYAVGLSRLVLLYKHINVFSGYVMELKSVVCPLAGRCRYQEGGWPFAASFRAPPS